MKFFYSMSLRGFFDEENVPDDARPLSEEKYRALIDGQSAGKLIDWSGTRPSLVDINTNTVEQAHADRITAYRRESDALKNEAEYDAMVAGTDPDYTAWLAKVAEIKARYPLPDQ
jgi:hypothetical protein